MAISARQEKAQGNILVRKVVSAVPLCCFTSHKPELAEVHRARPARPSKMIKHCRPPRVSSGPGMVSLLLESLN